MPTILLLSVLGVGVICSGIFLAVVMIISASESKKQGRTVYCYRKNLIGSGKTPEPVYFESFAEVLKSGLVFSDIFLAIDCAILIFFILMSH